MKTNNRARIFFAIPFVVFLIMFVLFPLLLLFYFAFFSGDGFSFEYVKNFFTDGSLQILLNSIIIALITAVICIALGYPVAYILAQSKAKSAPIILMLLIAPMWVNGLLRAFATKQLLYAVLGSNLQTGMGTLIIGLVLDFLPFMIMPIYTVLKNVSSKYREASADLGASPSQTFASVTLPLSIPGVISGFLMVFTPAVSTYYLSEYLGSSKTYMIGQQLNDVFNASFGKYGRGSVIAIILLLVVAMSVMATNRLSKIGNQRGGLW
ncbi:MAG: ABC transporter permease [Christensenellaceae bacterium]|jgi:spermidine/putrescine transport system permease protein|nr:ABC transporter permease [Christensenellaceae bacterium]